MLYYRKYPGPLYKSLILGLGLILIFWVDYSAWGFGPYLEFVRKLQNFGLKSNKNVSLSSEFELWTRSAGQIFERIYHFHFIVKWGSLYKLLIQRTRILVASVYGIFKLFNLLYWKGNCGPPINCNMVKLVDVRLYKVIGIFLNFLF